MTTLESAAVNLIDLPPVIKFPTQTEKITILLEAYKKHSAELLAIEESQQKLLNLILGVYAAGVTVTAGFLKDNNKSLLQGPNHTLSPLALALIAMIVLIGAYGLFMSIKRNDARRSVREALGNIDRALGFFESGIYLEAAPLYSERFKEYGILKSFLNYSYLLILAVGIVFIGAILSITLM